MIIFILSLYHPLFSQWKLNIGGNIAKFQSEDSDNNVGFIFGFSHSRKLKSIRNVEFQFGFLIAKQSANLSNKYLKFHEFPDEIYPLNMKYEGVCVKIPVAWNYILPIKKKIDLETGMGLLLNLAIKSNGETTTGDPLGSNDVKEKDIYEQFNDTYPFSTLIRNSGIDMYFSMGISANRIGIRAIYTSSLQSSLMVNAIKFNERMNVYNVVFEIIL